MHNSKKTEVALVKGDAELGICCRDLLAARNADMPITAKLSDNWGLAVR
jgi:predicted lipid carrier protein YhbT